MPHTWTEEDDILVLYMYKFGCERLGLTRRMVADRIGVSRGSLEYRIANFKALDGIGSATNYARLTQEVHARYSNLPEAQLRRLVLSRHPALVGDDQVIEGLLKEAKTFRRTRNAQLAKKRKEIDNYTCQVCGFCLSYKGRYVVDCHHLDPLAETGERKPTLDNLVTLCPTCHRIAHLQSPPLQPHEIRSLRGIGT